MKKRKGLILDFRNRKANAVLDLATFLSVLFVFIFCVFVGNIILSDVNEDAQTDPDMGNTSKEILQTQNTRYPQMFDGAFLFLFILFWILVLVASFKIDSHPIFFAITIILLIFMFIVAAYMGNAYEEFTAEEDFTTITPNYPIANWIMTHLLLAAIVIGFSITLVLFGKSRKGL